MARITRRAFAKDAILAATAAAAIPVTAQTSAPDAPRPPASAAEVEARVKWILTKYGARLDDEQRADIRRIITSGQTGIEAMRAWPIGNEVAPPQPYVVLASFDEPWRSRNATPGGGADRRKKGR